MLEMLNELAGEGYSITTYPGRDDAFVLRGNPSVKNAKGQDLCSVFTLGEHERDIDTIRAYVVAAISAFNEERADEDDRVLAEKFGYEDIRSHEFMMAKMDGSIG